MGYTLLDDSSVMQFSISSNDHHLRLFSGATTHTLVFCSIFRLNGTLNANQKIGAPSTICNHSANWSLKLAGSKLYSNEFGANIQWISNGHSSSYASKPIDNDQRLLDYFTQERHSNLWNAWWCLFHFWNQFFPPKAILVPDYQNSKAGLLCQPQLDHPWSVDSSDFSVWFPIYFNSVLACEGS